MPAPRRARPDDRGMTLIELLVAMGITSVVISVVMAGAVAILRVDQYAEEDSRALRELRGALADLTRELREARLVYPGSGSTASTARRIYFWVDRDRNNVQGASEKITWELIGSGTDGQLVRRTDAAPSNVIKASEILVADAFRYLGVTTAGKVTIAPPNTTLVAITLTADVSTATTGADPRTVSTEVRLRNAATRS